MSKRSRQDDIDYLNTISHMLKKAEERFDMNSGNHLTETHYDFNHQDETGWTPLFIAAANNHVDLNCLPHGAN